MKILLIARWMKMIAITPRTACDASHRSRNQRNSKKPISPMTAKKCAMLAMTAPNFTQQPLRTGPRKIEMKNNTSKTAAFQTIGPSAMTPIRISGLGGVTPLTGNDPTNMYAIVKMIARQIGLMISEKRTFLSFARGPSDENFSEGCPSFFFLYPVMAVRERRQYPIHELACVRELPRDIHRRNSL